MDIETKNAWVADLRSDKYHKINFRMSDDCNGRCVLGVLHEVAKARGLFNPMGCHYAELRTIGIVPIAFVRLNDCAQETGARYTFAEMADIIDAMPLDHPDFNYDPNINSFSIQ